MTSDDEGEEGAEAVSSGLLLLLAAGLSVTSASSRARAAALRTRAEGAGVSRMSSCSVFTLPAKAMFSVVILARTSSSACTPSRATRVKSCSSATASVFAESAA